MLKANLMELRAVCSILYLSTSQVELAVLADLLRQRVAELEGGIGLKNEKLGTPENTILRQMRHDLHAAKAGLQESQIRQKALEEEVAVFEAELVDDRELLDMAAHHSGIGVAEAIRRNKRLKSTLRKREHDIERCQDQLSAMFRVLDDIYVTRCLRTVQAIA